MRFLAEITELGKYHRVSCDRRYDRAAGILWDIAIHVVMESIISVRN